MAILIFYGLKMNIKLIDEFVIITLTNIIRNKANQYAEEVIKDSSKLAIIDFYNKYNIVLNILDNIIPNKDLETIIPSYIYNSINQEDFINFVNDDLYNIELLEYYNTNIADQKLIYSTTQMITDLINKTSIEIINNKVPSMINTLVPLVIKELETTITNSLTPIIYTELKPILINDILTNSTSIIIKNIIPELQTKLVNNIISNLTNELSIILIPIIKENIKSTLKLEIKNEILSELANE